MMSSATGKKLDSVSFDRLLEELKPYDSNDPIFDLSDVVLITPSAIVQVAAICHSLAADGKLPAIRLADSSVRTYLSRCGFFEAVQGIAQIEPALTRWEASECATLRGSNPMLIEVTHLADGSALPELLDKVVWVLRHRMKYRKRDSFDIATVVSELCQNTFDHNRNGSGFTGMQVYGHGTRRFLEVAVSDCGLGLRATLRKNRKNGPIPSDEAAIQKAIQLGVSEHDDPTRGTGLFHLLEITYRHKGSAQIKSGEAKVRYRGDRRQGWVFSVSSIPGVHISIDLPSKS